MQQTIVKAQAVKRKCCDSVFAACAEPYCYGEKDWHISVRDYAKRGFKIETIEVGFNFQHAADCVNFGTNKLELPAKPIPQLF